jgi:hypothetical protein
MIDKYFQAQAADLKEKKLKEELEKKRREGYEQEQKRLQVFAQFFNTLLFFWCFHQVILLQAKNCVVSA